MRQRKRERVTEREREREREKITWLQMCQREREMIVLCVRTRDGSVCERER